MPNVLLGQIDSSYIQPFEQAFSGRFYIVEKFFSFHKENEEDESQNITLKTNNPTSLGLGISWKSFSFSFSRGIDLFRQEKRGKTNSLEFQHHGYGRKFVYDIVLQQHSGFYNSLRGKDGSYQLHPDIKINYYGGGFQYVFNNKRFSYKAAFNQNEKQIKSAGSFLLGATLNYSKTRTGSSVLFEQLKDNHENLQIGASFGYAYTWVISDRWFVTGSLAGGITIGNNYPTRFFKEKMEILPILDGRFAMGYNANNWSLGLSSNFNRVFLFNDGNESLSMGNSIFRLTFIMRFDWGNKFVNTTLNKAHQKVETLKIF